MTDGFTDRGAEPGTGRKITLTATAPLTGDLPVTKGDMTISLVDPGPLTLIAPFRGQDQTVSDALSSVFDLTLPPVGAMAQSNGTTLQWFGRGQYMLAGGQASALALDPLIASVTDQTDGWVTLDLTGKDGPAVMARLVPVDLRLDAAPQGCALRTDLHGMMVAITRPSADTIRIMGFRSMAKTLTHAVVQAMDHVAALG